MSGLSPMRDGLVGATGVVVALVLACSPGPDDETIVASASSLRAAMPDLVAGFDPGDGARPLVVTYGGSGTLQRQVEAGAPVDIVVLAGAAPVDALVAAELADATSRRIIARNRLVLIGPADSEAIDFRSLSRLPAGERIAIGDPATVPAGYYAREALSALGVWDALQGRLVPAASVAAVLTYVERGEVAAGVVYATDAALGREIRILDRADDGGTIRPIVVAALTRHGGSNPQAQSFLDHISGAAGGAILARHGFLRP